MNVIVNRLNLRLSNTLLLFFTLVNKIQLCKKEASTHFKGLYSICVLPVQASDDQIPSINISTVNPSKKLE